tara:strand:+ start:482 stop:781 length:300 start_codon:yes stop_codon:yes gene_type:complete
MAHTTTWTITNMHRESADGYVYELFVNISAVDNADASNTASTNTKVGLDRPDTLVAYDSLNEATVIGWAQAGLGTTICNNIETYFTDKLAKKTLNGKPW